MREVGRSPSWAPMAPATRKGGGGPMSSDRRLIRRLITELLDKGSLRAADDLLAADFVLHHPASPEGVRGPESQKVLITKFPTARPDPPVGRGPALPDRHAASAS